MKVLVLSSSTDIAGVGIALKRAFDHCSTDWTARMVRRRPGPFGYPADIEWPKGDRKTGRLVEALFDEADVIHVLQNPSVVSGFNHRSKAIVVQHLGSYFRDNPEAVSAACAGYGAVEVSGGPDIMPLLPADAEFLPIAADLDAFATIRQRVYRPSERVRVAHAPTNRAAKSTEAIIAACDGLPVDLDIIEGVSWAECVERKAQTDIFIDELTRGYGMNAIEAWGMGIPVISGIASRDVREIMVGIFGALPFLEATEDSLPRVIRTLAGDPDLREAISRRGAAHAQRFHSEASVVERAIGIYQRAMNR